MTETKKVRANDQTLRWLTGHGVEFAATTGDKVPIYPGWQEKNLDAVASMADTYAAGQYFLARLDNSAIVIADIDDLKHAKSQQIIALAKEHEVYRAETRRGMHLFFRRGRDSEALLRGKQTQKILSSGRKNSKPIGDLLGDKAIAYHIIGGHSLLQISEIPGMYELLSCGDEVPELKAERIYTDIVAKLAEAKNGERNSKMFLLVNELRRRLVATGLEASCRDYMLRLSQEYERINPDDAAAFGEARIDELLAEPCSVEANKEIGDIAKAVVAGYIESHADAVMVDSASNNDDGRKVFEWDVMQHEWTQRFLCKRKMDGTASVAKELCDTYEAMYNDQKNQEAADSQVMAAKKTMIERLKTESMADAARGQFDRIDGMVSKAYLGDGQVLTIDTDKWLVRVGNGNRPEDKLLAKMGNIADKPSELWQQFISDIFGGDQELIDFVGLFIASAFVPGTPPMFGICHGVGANGKSVFLTSLANALNEHAVSITQGAFIRAGMGIDTKRQLDQRGAMVGKRLSVCVEASKTFLDMEFIKRLTSGEPVEIGGMYKASEKVEINTLPIIATNELPRLHDLSLGVRRRIIMLPFKQIFGHGDKPADPQLISKLEKETAGIRRWLVDQIERLVAARGEMEMPEIVRQGNEQYMDKQTHPVAADLQRWIRPAKYREPGKLKLGRRKMVGKDSTYSGVMALAMQSWNDQNISKGKPTRENVKTWLTDMQIESDGRGTLNAVLTDDWYAYKKESGCNIGDADLIAASSSPIKEIPAEPEEFNFGADNDTAGFSGN